MARLQHDRLELTVIVSPTLGNLLVRDPAAPEAPDLNSTSIDLYRARLLLLAAGFYEIRDGDSVLKPEQIRIGFNKTQEPEFSFVYPAPVVGPLRVRAVGLSAAGPEGTNFLRVYDDNEQVLAMKLLSPAGTDSDPAAELILPLSAPVAAKPAAKP